MRACLHTVSVMFVFASTAILLLAIAMLAPFSAAANEIHIDEYGIERKVIFDEGGEKAFWAYDKGLLVLENSDGTFPTLVEAYLKQEERIAIAGVLASAIANDLRDDCYAKVTKGLPDDMPLLVASELTFDNERTRLDAGMAINLSAEASIMQGNVVLHGKMICHYGLSNSKFVLRDGTFSSF